MRASYGEEDVLVSQAEWLVFPFKSKYLLGDLNAEYLTYLYLPGVDPRSQGQSYNMLIFNHFIRIVGRR